MKEKPGISASPSLPFPVLGESQGYDSEPQTASKRHRNGTSQYNTAPHLLGNPSSHLGWSPAT